MTCTQKHINKWYLYGTPGSYLVTDIENAGRQIMDASKTYRVLVNTLEEAIDAVHKWLMRDGDTLTIDLSPR